MRSYNYRASGDYMKDREKFLNQGFPGFKVCMKLLRSHDPQKKEDGSYLLAQHAAEYLDELIAEFNHKENENIRYWLIELIGKAKSPTTIPFLIEHLYGPVESLRRGAIYGLIELDTKEARTILWQARSHKFESEEETKEFQDDLARILENNSKWVQQ